MDPRALAAATPADRNRVVDFLRAAAILTVVLGHWLMAAVTVRDGAFVPDAVLNIAPWSHPLTWVFQVMPLFFIVGGYANGLSWRSARRRGTPYAAWLRSRLQRLAGPVLPLLLVWLVIATVAYAAGVPGGTLRTASQVALVPDLVPRGIHRRGGAGARACWRCGSGGAGGASPRAWRSARRSTR